MNKETNQYRLKMNIKTQIIVIGKDQKDKKKNRLHATENKKNREMVLN